MKKLLILSFTCSAIISLHAQVTITPQVQLIKDNLNTSSSYRADISEYQVHSGKLYFNSSTGSNFHSALYVTDGTKAGTNILISSAGNIFHSLCSTTNNLVFLSHLGSAYSERSQLYSSDGTVLGTHSIANGITVGNNYAVNTDADNSLVEYNGKAYFSGDDGIHGLELWATDGTNSGTTMVKDLASGADSSRPVCFTKWNNKLYFVTSSLNAYYLYVTDGTANGTTLIKAIPVSYISSVKLAIGMFEYNSKLYFTMYDFDQSLNSTTTYLYATDGTTGGTALVKSLPFNASIQEYAVFNNEMYFVIRNTASGGVYLYKTDGTDAGTTNVQVTTGVGLLRLHIKSFNGYLFTGWLDNNHYGELVSNAPGGSGSTTLLTVSNSMNLTAHPHDFVEWNNTLYFLAPTNNSPSNIYSTDGTQLGTIIVGPSSPTFATFCLKLTSDAIYKDSMYFEGVYPATLGNSQTDLYKLHLKVDTVITNTVDPISKQSSVVRVCPNPANGNANVTYALKNTGDVILSIIDLNGSTVYTVTKHQQSGIQNEHLNLSHFIPGVYVVNIKSSEFSETLKLLVQ